MNHQARHPCSFLCKAGKSSILWIYHILCVCSSGDGHFGCSFWHGPFNSFRTALPSDTARWDGRQSSSVSAAMWPSTKSASLFPQWFFTHSLIALLWFGDLIIRVTLAHFWTCPHLMEGQSAHYHQWEKENMASSLSYPFLLMELHIVGRVSGGDFQYRSLFSFK